MYLPESFIIPNGEGSNPSEWGPWSSPSECSRSCGGGVAYQTRECLHFALVYLFLIKYRISACCFKRIKRVIELSETNKKPQKEEGVFLIAQ